MNCHMKKGKKKDGGRLAAFPVRTRKKGGKTRNTFTDAKNSIPQTKICQPPNEKEKAAVIRGTGSGDADSTSLFAESVAGNRKAG